jgi:hypothetical protein
VAGKVVRSSEYSPDISKSGPGCGGVAMYILSAVLVIFTIGAIAAYVVLFVNPDLPFNPFREATLTATAALPVGTPTEIIIFPSTASPTAAVVPSATRTATPTSASTATEVPTATSEPAPPTTPSPTPYPLVLQPSGIKAAQGFKGCSWTGVSGQIFGPNNGEPIKYLLVHLEGTWN